MAAQQLVRYVADQRKVGVADEAIKGALIEAGWAEMEIKEAMAGPATPEVSQAVEPKPVMRMEPMRMEAKPMPQSTPMMDVKPKTPAMGAMGLEKPAMQMPQMPSMQQKSVSAMKPVASSPMMKPTMMDMKPQAPVMEMQKRSHGSLVPWALVGILGLTVVGGGVYIAIQQGTGNTSLAEKDAALQAAQVNITTLTKEVETVKAERDTARAEKAVVENELQLITPSTSSIDEAFVLTGTVTKNEKNQYLVTTAHKIVFVIGNTKDAGVEAAIKNVLGTEATISGSHLPGSFLLRVMMVNGVATTPAPAPAPMPVTTSTVSSSTPN